MSESEPDEEDVPKKKSKLPLIIGLVMALIGGGGGFFATWSGMILAPESSEHAAEEETQVESVADVAFVPVEPMVVSLSGSSRAKHLRFRAQLEVPAAFQPDVEKLLPRVVDVLNSYLRALEVADLEDQSALTRLRAQMLRRVQIVAGQGRVNDLLIMEFVLN